MSLGNPDDISSSVREGRHPTGVDILDDEILRGIPKGSTIAVVGDPDSASELLLHSLAATGRNTEYVTTLRPQQGLMSDIKRAARDSVDESEIEENVTIRDVFQDTDDIGDTVRKSLSLVENGNLIVDTFSMKYDSPKTMLDIARRIQMKTNSNNGLTYLYFVAKDVDDLSRNEQEILQMVDGVFNIKTQIVGTDNVENNLYINKLRGTDLPDNAQSLIFGERLTIDVTADIG